MNNKCKKLQCREIINAAITNLQLADIQVIFDSEVILEQNLQRNGQIVFLHAIDDYHERKAYEAKTESEKSSYITQSPRIHFPDLSVEKLIAMFQTDISGVYKDTSEIVNHIHMKFPCPIEIRSILFMFLHEVGHWYQLMQKCNGRVKEYSETDRDLSEKNFNETQALHRKIINRYPNKQEQHEIRRLQNEYRQIPKEADADTFAKAKMQEVDIAYILQN